MNYHIIVIVYLKGDVGNMSKKKLIIGSVSLVVATVICTILVQVFLFKGVFMSRSLYEKYKKYDKLIALENIVEEDYYQDVNEDKLIVGAEKGLIESLEDPYSQYYTKEEFDLLKDFWIQLCLSEELLIILLVHQFLGYLILSLQIING